VPSDPAPPFVSRLGEPSQRFLSRVLEHALTTGLRAPEEFLRHFGPMDLMIALAEQPTRRARILEATVGLRPRVALRKSPQSAAEDLQLALDEGETDAATVLGLVDPDDRVQFLDNAKLWTFLVEPRWWATPHELGDRLEQVREHTAFVIQCGLDEGLLTPTDIVNAVSVPSLVDCLPADLVVRVVERALVDGRNAAAFTDEALLEAVGLQGLVAHVPLHTLWEWVIGAKIAGRNGLVADSEVLFDESEAHPDASGEPPEGPLGEEPKTAEL
jgi:hypothetical protein